MCFCMRKQRCQTGRITLLLNQNGKQLFCQLGRIIYYIFALFGHVCSFLIVFAELSHPQAILSLPDPGNAKLYHSVSYYFKLSGNCPKIVRDTLATSSAVSRTIFFTVLFIFLVASSRTKNFRISERILACFLSPPSRQFNFFSGFGSVVFEYKNTY